MPYLRIDRTKFWGWVVVSLLAGLGIGFGVMFALSAARSDETRVLRNRADSVQAQLASAETSLSALAAQNSQLTIDLEGANAQIASLQAAAGTDQTTTPPPSGTTTMTVTSRTITPSSVVASENVTLTMTAKVTGSPEKVTMRIYNASKSYDKTYALKKISTSGDTQTWRATTKAPPRVGTYNYFATAISGTIKVTMTGVNSATFKVK